jgi:hypothetical protein
MDIKTTAVKSLKGACNIFLQDLQALPEEAFCKSFGPKVRTVADIVYEVNMVNNHVSMVIRGDAPFLWPDGWVTAPADFCTKEIVIAAFEKSSQAAIATVEGYSSEELDATLQTDEGETTRFERSRFMTLHLWYHSGQLNFIQTLMGDDGWNWK